MRIQIRRHTEKELGTRVATYFSAEIDGKESRGYYIFRKLLGITCETENGLLSSGKIQIAIGDDKTTFQWDEDPYTIEACQLQETLQRRIGEIQQWIATLTYLRTDEFTVEV